MRRLSLYYIAACTAAIVSTACNDSSNDKTATEENNAADSTAQQSASQPAPAIKEETVAYKGDGVTMKGFLAYDSANTAKRPAVLIVPEWWGLTDYPKMRARELAKMGYVAFAMDMYGDGKVAEDPGAANKAAEPFYKNPQKAKARIDAALAQIKSMSQTDTSKLAAIGYCFGGGMVLNAARLGENVKGTVSFHGMLIGTPAKKELLRSKILVCHGEADQFVKPGEVAAFKKQMDSIGADYTFKSYPNANHAFTNPEASSRSLYPAMSETG